MLDRSHDGKVSEAERASYLNTRTGKLQRELRLTLDGVEAPLRVHLYRSGFPAGASGAGDHAPGHRVRGGRIAGEGAPNISRLRRWELRAEEGLGGSRSWSPARGAADPLHRSGHGPIEPAARLPARARRQLSRKSGWPGRRSPSPERPPCEVRRAKLLRIRPLKGRRASYRPLPGPGPAGPSRCRSGREPFRACRAELRPIWDAGRSAASWSLGRGPCLLAGAWQGRRRGLPGRGARHRSPRRLPGVDGHGHPYPGRVRARAADPLCRAVRASGDALPMALAGRQPRGGVRRGEPAAEPREVATGRPG